MAAFTVNTIAAEGDWHIIDAYSTDVSTSTALLAANGEQDYLVKSVSVEINHSDCWFRLFDGTTLRIGPVKPRANNYHREYESPIVFSGAINVQTESDKQIHITLAYKLRP